MLTNFRPHTECTPLDRSPKNLVQVIRSAAPNLVQIRILGKSILGEWTKYDDFLKIYLSSFLGTHLQVRHLDGFSRLMTQTTRTRATVCILGVSLILFPFLWVKSPPNSLPQFWGLNRRFRFKPNWQNIEIFVLSKILHPFQPNFTIIIIIIFIRLKTQ